jgi:heat-inducible transcriptional repressor
MSELEAKGFLFHMHTSAGRIPTDLGYRLYVNDLMRLVPIASQDQEVLRRELHPDRTAIEEILRRAAQVLGVLTQELGVAAGPRLDAVVLDRLDLVHLSSERLLLVFNLKSGAIRTIFVQIPAVSPRHRGARGADPQRALAGPRSGHSRDLAARLRDADGSGQSGELLNIFVAEGEEIFDLGPDPDGIVLGARSCSPTSPVRVQRHARPPQSHRAPRRLREALLARQRAG